MDNSALVSAIMPTRGRQEFAQRAVECWRSQTHQNRELVIVDDQDDPSFPFGLQEDRITYWSEPIRYNIPMKLNMLCRAARGDVLCRLDSDDWSHPQRIETQLELLLKSGMGLVGYHSIVFVDESGQTRKYRGPSCYCLGSSMMFTRKFWQANPWKENKPVGSDLYFSNAAKDSYQLISVDAGDMMYARVHSGNTSPKRWDQYAALKPGELPAVLAV